MQQILHRTPPLLASVKLDEVIEQLSSTKYKLQLSLPIVDEEGKLLGAISRHQLLEMLAKRYWRELYSRQPVTVVMNNRPLTVSVHDSLDQISDYLLKNMRLPLTEDFMVVDGEYYVGTGQIMDVLRVMQNRQIRQNAEIRKAYVQLRQSQAQLIQSEKMAALGQLVAGVAHEINTPLGYIKNNVEMSRDIFAQIREALVAYQALHNALINGQADEPVIQTLIQELTEFAQELGTEELEDLATLFDDTLFGINQISELVMSLKNFSRLDRAATENVDLHENIESTLTIARNMLKKGIQVEKHYADNLPRIRCAPSQINQVLLNIITNACQAIEHDQGRIQIKTYLHQNDACISIQDNGKGMDAATQARIFDPFFTTKPVGEGTGLGLAISCQIIEQHGGRIRLASKPGVGTRFEIRLPINVKEAATTVAATQDRQLEENNP